MKNKSWRDKITVNIRDRFGQIAPFELSCRVQHRRDTSILSLQTKSFSSLRAVARKEIITEAMSMVKSRKKDAKFMKNSLPRYLACLSDYI